MGQQLRGTVVAAQCQADTALTFCCSGGCPRQPWSSGLAPVSSLHSSLPPRPPTLIGHLASVDVNQNYSFIYNRRSKCNGGGRRGGTRLESGANLLSPVGRVTLRYTQCFETKASSAPVRGLLAVERLMGLHGYDNRGGIRVKKKKSVQSALADTGTLSYSLYILT